jgi:MFS family permease
MGYITVTYGLGCISGPLIGSFLYTLGGYQCPLFTLGGLYLIMIITLWPLAKEERLK